MTTAREKTFNPTRNSFTDIATFQFIYDILPRYGVKSIYTIRFQDTSLLISHLKPTTTVLSVISRVRSHDVHRSVDARAKISICCCIHYLKSKQNYVVSNPLDCSKRITLHPLADLFIPTPIGHLWKAFSHAA